MKNFLIMLIVPGLILFLCMTAAYGASEAFGDNIYNPGQLKPVDSTLKVKVGGAKDADQLIKKLLQDSGLL